ncbi:RNA processing exonuclease, beta-lactamase fold, Cft2 family [Sinosporangium album]|uniref:RNA processing exonuclease, beta-lactamase fold, Cft2 family n=1 Tax=Sinosporangium album TaxID=504805 RepID=A0A1G7SC47_9ACTN|nr:MBL fold metallo-hydrolase [Sinosporangium album]SDG20551.1 RNA processing exonuclease, beta-lactamase fold, Cft2 family [Sinosporangium album]
MTDPLLPILQAAAEVFLSRPALAGEEHDRDRFVSDRRQMILDAVATLPALRDRIRERLHTPRNRSDVEALATLILSTDDATVRAALRLAEQLDRERLAQHTLRKRYQNKVHELQSRLETAKGRHQHAAAALETARHAVTELEKRVDELDTQVSALQDRLRDPRVLAANLLGLLQQPSQEHDEGPETRDPRNHGQQDRPAPLAALAAHAAGIDPERFLTALQTLITPRPTRPRVTVVQERRLRVHPLGGASEIGGSCLLVEAGGTRLLVDAGLRPGDPALPPRDIDEALSGPIHAVVVTHAHTDHCGYVPALVDRYPELRVIATSETALLMPQMWTDSAKLMGERERLHRQWGSYGEALYRRGSVEAAARRCEELPYGVECLIGDVTVELFPAGHILGAAGVVVRAGSQRIVVTGDISGFRQETVDGYAIPRSAREADLLVMESTCCAEDHAPRETRVNDLVRAVEEVYAGGGRVLIPAFALGRAQELALIMRTHLPHIPVLVDGMAATIASSFERITAQHPSPLRIFGGNVSRAQDMRKPMPFTSGVVITTSGMLTGGPVIQWAAEILPEPHSALFLSGYQDEESAGAKLLRLVKEQASHLTVNDHGIERNIPLNARIDMMRLSAHADKRGLLEIADEVGARQVMLVHGLSRRQRDFHKILQIRGHGFAATGPWA